MTRKKNSRKQRKKNRVKELDQKEKRSQEIAEVCDPILNSADAAALEEEEAAAEAKRAQQIEAAISDSAGEECTDSEETENAASGDYPTQELSSDTMKLEIFDLADMGKNEGAESRRVKVQIPENSEDSVPPCRDAGRENESAAGMSDSDQGERAAGEYDGAEAVPADSAAADEAVCAAADEPDSAAEELPQEMHSREKSAPQDVTGDTCRLADFTAEELEEEAEEERLAAGAAAQNAAGSEEFSGEEKAAEEMEKDAAPAGTPGGISGVWKRFCGMKLWCRIVAVVLVLVLALGLCAYGYFHSKYVKLNISDGKFSSSEVSPEGDEEDELANEELKTRQDSEELEEQEAVEATGEIWSDSSVFNILLIGTDDRTTEFSDNARGDTCILLSINRDTNQLHLVSFERAIGVKIPSGEYEGQWDWLTHMFWYGGPYMMTQVIRENFKVDVTKYIRVNIRTFMKLVDAVGGVDIDMTEAECNNINHPEGTYTAGHIKGLHVENEVQQDLVAGVNHLNGATAMLYARLRAIDDDWHRVERQRKVIIAAMQNLKELSVTELDSLLNEVLPLVQTNLTEADIASLIPEAGTFINMDYDTITFPLKHTYGLMDGMCGRRVLALDFETNSQELQSFLNGETTSEELTEKYENSDLGSYSYRNSDSYQQNYQDAEAAVGKSTYTQTTGKSKPSLVETQSQTESGAASSPSGTAAGGADTGTAAQTESAGDAAAQSQTESGAQEESSSLGTVESTSTDPATGIVTIIYYNAATGVRTAIASNPASGATTVTANDTTNGATATIYADGTAAAEAAQADAGGTADAAGTADAGNDAGQAAGQ
jgi:LCP family protein required for cell wall assembly